MSQDPTALIASRAVMGVGGAFVMPATLSILTDVFPRRERAKAIAAWSSIAGVGIVVGPALGGLLLDSFSWHSVFWVNVPLVMVALVAVSAVVPALRLRRSRDSRLATRDSTFRAVLSARVGALRRGCERTVGDRLLPRCGEGPGPRTGRHTAACSCSISIIAMAWRRGFGAASQPLSRTAPILFPRPMEPEGAGV